MYTIHSEQGTPQIFPPTSQFYLTKTYESGIKPLIELFARKLIPIFPKLLVNLSFLSLNSLLFLFIPPLFKHHCCIYSKNLTFDLNCFAKVPSSEATNDTHITIPMQVQGRTDCISATERSRLLKFSSNENSARCSQLPKLKATN